MNATETPRPRPMGEDGDATEQTLEGLASASGSALGWLVQVLRHLEEAVSEMSPDPNSLTLLSCRTALARAEVVIEGLTPHEIRCPHCKSGLLWSEDRGPHCDGCDDFDPESDLPDLPNTELSQRS